MSYRQSQYQTDSSRSHQIDQDAAHFGPIANTIITTLSQDNLFWLCLVIVEILGIILLVCSILWMIQIGGFGFGDNIFNFHPVCMTLGMIVCNANGMFFFLVQKMIIMIHYFILSFLFQAF